MGFFNNIIKIAQKDMQRRATQTLKEKGNSLSTEQRTKLEKISNNVGATKASTSGSSRSNSASKNEKTINEWEREWHSIGVLSDIDLSPFSSSVGVYKATKSGTVVYVGRAVEFANGGFRKRLSDYRRESDSARKHKSGKLMYEHADHLNISIIITGSDSEAASIAKQLEKMLVAKYNPEWNTMLKSKLM